METKGDGKLDHRDLKTTAAGTGGSPGHCTMLWRMLESLGQSAWTGAPHRTLEVLASLSDVVRVRQQQGRQLKAGGGLSCRQLPAGRGL